MRGRRGVLPLTFNARLQLQAHGLTPRETEVVTAELTGKSTVGIGAHLGMRPRTVEKHREHIYEKLGVDSRTAAIARCLQLLGLIAVPDESRPLARIRLRS